MENLKKTTKCIERKYFIETMKQIQKKKRLVRKTGVLCVYTSSLTLWKEFSPLLSIIRLHVCWLNSSTDLPYDLGQGTYYPNALYPTY